MGTQTIETDRLILRRFTVDDAQDMFDNWANDADVCEYLEWDPHGNVAVTQDLLRGWVQAYGDESFYNWAVELKQIGKPIGSIAAVMFSEKHKCCEIGYCISKIYWSQGIMAEALKAVIKYFFTQVGLNRVSAGHDVQNVGSGKVMLKAGMTLEGTQRQRRIRRDGTFADGNMYSILSSEYINSK